MVLKASSMNPKPASKEEKKYELRRDEKGKGYLYRLDKDHSKKAEKKSEEKSEDKKEEKKKSKKK